MALVRVHADGVIGFGEAVPLSLRGGDTLARVVADLERNGVLLTGAEVDPAHWARPAASLPAEISRPAAAAIEIALLDLAGKVAGEPAWRLLGAREAHAVRCNATLTGGPPGEVARQAVAWAERGFETFKVKVGMDGDVEQVAAAHGALDSDARVRVDANGTWAVEEAGARLAAMGPLELAEEPVTGLEAMARLRAEEALPLVADESIASLADAEQADDLGACDMATVKLAKVGGPIAAVAIARVLPVYLSSALDGPVGVAAAAHLAQALPDAGVAHGLATSLLFADTIGRGAELNGPLLQVADAPGLGVDLDDEALARLAI
jgi:muconate cycloisomerase